MLNAHTFCVIIRVLSLNGLFQKTYRIYIGTFRIFIFAEIFVRNRNKLFVTAHVLQLAICEFNLSFSNFTGIRI